MKNELKGENMKSNFCAFVFFSSFLFLGSSYSDFTESTRVEAVQEQQLDDSQIINIMMTVDKGELSAVQEATKRKLPASIDLYAKYLIQQHQQNLEELSLLAKQLNMQPKVSVISTSMVASGQNEIKALNELQGNAFDKAFIDSIVKGHKEGLDLIDTKLLPQTKNPQLKAFVEKFRSMVLEHLEKGIKIQKTL